MNLKLNWKNFELDISSEEISTITEAIVFSEAYFQANKNSFFIDNLKEDESYSSSLIFWKKLDSGEEIDCSVQDISNGIRALTNEIGIETSSWNDSGSYGFDFKKYDNMNNIKKKLCIFLIDFFQTQHDLNYVNYDENNQQK